ncbi:MAG: MFS transporter, partial [Cyclobacteriaceae bacterium]
LLVPNGPFRKKSTGFDYKQCLKVFDNKSFRNAAFGYFGHMWELYTFWAFVPVMLILYNTQEQADVLEIRIWSFAIIAVGGISCVIGGLWSERIGSKRVALYALACSCLCCILSLLSFHLPPTLFVVFLLFWGMTVIADSPQFSTLVAQAAPAEYKGTALTIVNSIGFAITIVSLQVMNLLVQQVDGKLIYATLAVGPVFGLIALVRKNATP